MRNSGCLLKTLVFFRQTLKKCFFSYTLNLYRSTVTHALVITGQGITAPTRYQQNSNQSSNTVNKYEYEYGDFRTETVTLAVPVVVLDPHEDVIHPLSAHG